MVKGKPPEGGGGKRGVVAVCCCWGLEVVGVCI